MKTIIYSVLITLALAGFWALTEMEFSQVYQAEVKEVIVDTTPDWAKDEDARQAAEAVIKRKALESELAVVNADIKKLEARQAEIELDLGF